VAKVRATNQEQLEQLREICKDDFWTFMQFTHPNRVYGQVHKEMADFLTKPDARPNQLCLIPRAHMKSHVIAVWCAWWIYKNPHTTILYISATATLAEAQLYAIKNILSSKEFELLSPEMLAREEGKREQWSATAIKVDHPKRKEEGIRDSTVTSAGVTTNTTGLHADVIVCDDVVVPDNAYTEEGRRKVSAAMSQMASIKNTGGVTKAVGTRYHPRDQYYIWKEQKVKVYDDEDNVIDEEPLWEILEKKVEEFGVFLWPRTQRQDGNWFGFDRRELAKIEAEYTDRTQFFAQYYNEPNDISTQRISSEKFQYYDPKFLKFFDGRWHFKLKPLNVYASIDFAFSLSKAADYTAIVVIGIDDEGLVYILDIERFKTDKISGYFERISNLHSKWDFRKLRAEVTVAQQIIVRDLKDHFTRNGMSLSIDEFRPTGKKEERIQAVLDHRYDNMSMYHFRGGYTQILEDELVQQNPPHDDIKDALASAVEIAVKPMKRRNKEDKMKKVIFNSRWGGVG
jgi:phage terminase large subunit-like protein